uniref:Putative secreted protein n=1 Tax=Anopheles marajoara TaxID=58244 RepID=A0A2M4CDA9_9DIPT
MYFSVSFMSIVMTGVMSEVRYTMAGTTTLYTKMAPKMYFRVDGHFQNTIMMARPKMYSCRSVARYQEGMKHGSPHPM